MVYSVAINLLLFHTKNGWRTEILILNIFDFIIKFTKLRKVGGFLVSNKMLELIVNKNEDLETIVLVENGKMLEHYISTENERKRRLEGNIYIAQVGDIINGMQAAFIDYGEKKKGFIHLKDVLPKVDETKEKIDNTINISF